MNRPTEQTQEKNHTYSSTLISLFEQKGYECEEISHDKGTIYVMKYQLSHQEKPFEPKPKITIN
jgi:hypothetical protein